MSQKNELIKSLEGKKSINPKIDKAIADKLKTLKSNKTILK